MDIGEVTVDRDRDRRARHEPCQHPVEHSALVQLRVKTRIRAPARLVGQQGPGEWGIPEEEATLTGIPTTSCLRTMQAIVG